MMEMAKGDSVYVYNGLKKKGHFQKFNSCPHCGKFYFFRKEKCDFCYFSNYFGGEFKGFYRTSFYTEKYSVAIYNNKNSYVYLKNNDSIVKVFLFKLKLTINDEEIDKYLMLT